MRVYLIIILTLISINFDVAAANSHAKSKKVDTKCHVELVEGREVIYFARIKRNQVNALAYTLPGRQISVPFAREKQRVKQAFECVLLESKFNSRKANDLFEKQPR